jgi:hypothetical protein
LGLLLNWHHKSESAHLKKSAEDARDRASSNEVQVAELIATNLVLSLKLEEYRSNNVILAAMSLQQMKSDAHIKAFTSLDRVMFMELVKDAPKGPVSFVHYWDINNKSRYPLFPGSGTSPNNAFNYDNVMTYPGDPYLDTL